MHLASIVTDDMLAGVVLYMLVLGVSVIQSFVCCNLQPNGKTIHVLWYTG